MPYNPDEAQRLLQQIPAHRHMPSASLIVALGEQLTGVEDFTRTLREELRTAKDDLSSAKRALKTEEQHHLETMDELRALKQKPAAAAAKAAPAPPAKKPKKKANAAQQPV